MHLAKTTLKKPENGIIADTMTSIRESISDMESRLAAAGVPMADFFSAADIHYTTWRRWKKGVGPTLKNWERAKEVADNLIAAATANVA